MATAEWEATAMAHPYVIFYGTRHRRRVTQRSGSPSRDPSLATEEPYLAPLGLSTGMEKEERVRDGAKDGAGRHTHLSRQQA